MIYFNFKDYEEFKSLFGMRKTNNGDYVRKEKVTLNVLKDMFRNKQNDPARWDKFFFSKTVSQPMSQNDLIKAGKFIGGGKYTNELIKGTYTLSSDEYRVDSMGLCYDGDVKAIRYEHDGHIYKMKASKFFCKIWEEHGLDKFYGSKAGTFCCEKFAEAWTAYAQQEVASDLYTLYVGDDLEDFKKIYSSDKNFGSCMRNQGQYYFYHEAVDASAAWLENKDGEMVCRCVIFNSCTQHGTDKKFRIAERQYAIDEDGKLKNILVQRLYAEGRIDYHKRVGASCSDGWQDICDRNGDIIDNPYFSIKCNLEFGDTLSYQDSFKKYDYDRNIAYNHGMCHYDHELDTTDTYFEDEGEWDYWAQETYYREEMYTAYWYDEGCGRMMSGMVAECNIDEYFVRCDRGRYYDEYVYQGDVVTIDGDDWCKYDDDIVEIDGEWYEKGVGCEICKDTGDYEANYIEWEIGCCTYYYANYTYSELLGKKVPDDLFDEVEQKYAEDHGFVMNDDGEWVEVEELEEEVVAA